MTRVSSAAKDGSLQSRWSEVRRMATPPIC
jgi:hypothetical protein